MRSWPLLCTDVDIATFDATNAIVCYRSITGVGISGGYCVHIAISSPPSYLAAGAPVGYCGATFGRSTAVYR